MMIRENTESDMRGSPPSRWSDLILVLSVWSSVMLTVSSAFPFGCPRHAGHVNRVKNIITIGGGNILINIFFWGLILSKIVHL